MSIKIDIPSGTTVNSTVSGVFTLNGYVINPSGATSGQVLKYNGSSFIAANETGGGGGSTAIGDLITGATAKSVLFIDNSGELAQNNTNFFFDPSTSRLQVYEIGSISGSDPLRLGTGVASAINIGHSGINLGLTGLLTVTDGAQALTFNATTGLSFFGFIFDFSGGGPTVTSPGTYDLYLWKSGQNVIIKGDNLIPSSNNAKSLGSSSAQWKDGYFGGKIVLDGYQLDLSAGATTNQVLQYNGTKFIAATVSGGGGNAIPAITTVSDANHTTSGSETIEYTSLTAQRTVTGTTSGSTSTPNIVIIKDNSGKASPSTSIIFTPSSGTVEGVSSITAVSAPLGQALFYCDGTNWFQYNRRNYNLFFDLPAWAQAYNIGGTGGNYTNGTCFYAHRSMVIYGVRWWQGSGFTPLSTTVSLWKSSGPTRLGMTTVTPTQGAINVAFFSSPITITDFTQIYSVSVYDGSNQILYPAPSIGTGPFPWGPYMLYYGSNYGGGDSMPTGGGGNQYAACEPIYSVIE